MVQACFPISPFCCVGEEEERQTGTNGKLLEMSSCSQVELRENPWFLPSSDQERHVSPCLVLLGSDPPLTKFTFKHQVESRDYL